MAAEIKRPILKGPRVIPPRLTTKSSTDLLPLEMRLGTSKEAQPAAILKQKLVKRLDIPAQPQTRRKSATDIDHQKKFAGRDQTGQSTASLLYVHCKLNGDEAVAMIDTGRVESIIPRGIAQAYGLIAVGGKEINNHSNGATHKCPEIRTDDFRIVTQLRLGRAPFECNLTVVPDDSNVLLTTIGMDVLHRHKCILDVSSRVIYLDGLSGDAKQLLTHEEVFGDTRLVRSQSSTL
ncbi:protein DDI1 homolog 1-like [Patiria miniata]|uniref:Aspartic peptidase DDI1-type domain-containing protein n=1 Tax=Patiria miniata TaxID=46514 RepID=A0A913ZV51_PATMI|nr:protein DDI1 homolog 1-like [Patiria miniata]